LEIRPFGFKVEFRHLLRPLAKIEKERHERALDRQSHCDQRQDAELRSVDESALRAPEANGAGEDGCATAENYRRARRKDLPRRSRETAKALASP